ncbi:MAG: FxLYD domain-containing protein [Candidatus Sulfotelmatobacter sp.]
MYRGKRGASAPRHGKIDIHFLTAYNFPMGTLGQPTPVVEERDNSRLIIIGAVVVVIGIALAAAFFLREPPKKVALPSPYIAQLKLSDFKMSAAENFIGATVSYIDGTITNTSNKTVTRVMVEVNFLDSMGQLAQREELPLRLFRNNGAYNEPVDLNVAPLGPGQSEPFRLTFDSISAQWNHQYPDIRITDVTTK